jgi:hypothetical protein
MTDFGRPEESEDPNKLRSAAVDALQNAARQSDPQEFNRLTRHALALIERARAIGRGREGAVSEAAGNDKMEPQPSSKIIKLIVRLRRLWSPNARR